MLHFTLIIQINCNSRVLYLNKSALKLIISLQAKGTAISTGARQAAQTLNVPLDHLESTPSRNEQHHHHETMNGNGMNGHHHGGGDAMPTRNGISMDRHQTASPDDYPPQYVHRKNSLNTQESISPNREHPSSHTDTIQQSNGKHSLLQFAIQHFRNE